MFREDGLATLPPPTKPITPRPTPVRPPKPGRSNPLQPTRPNIKPRPKATLEEDGPATLPRPAKPRTLPVRKPAPNKPNPLQPTRPDIKPRPKAISRDIQAFINVRKSVSEAIDTTGYPDFIDPERRSHIEDEIDYVEQIFPDLDPQEHRYLEIITSESYKNAVNKAAHYLGKTVEEIGHMFPDLPTMIGLFMRSAQEIEQLERHSKERLEKLSIELVLGLEEYQLFKPLVESGQIKLDVKIDLPNLSGGIAEDELDKISGNGLTIGENINAQLGAGLSGDTEGKLRRTLANYITQGDAVNKFWSFNQVNDQLREISPNLPQKYGFIAAASSIMYYYAPMMSHNRQFFDIAAAGSEQITPNEDGGYTFKIRGRNFILLIHELVKAFNDYLSMDIASQDELDTETLKDEVKQILAGPGLDLRLRNLLPSNKLKFLPLVKRLIYRLPIPQIKVLLSGGHKAEILMKQLVQTAEQQQSDYQSPSEEPQQQSDYHGGEDNDSADYWKK